MGPKLKRESYNEAKDSCEVVTLDEKIKIVAKLRGSVCAAAVALTFSWCFILV
jgi:hypothetical protein